MKVGFVGLGKLGLPVATCLAMQGHDVIGYDVDPKRMTKKPQPQKEEGPGGKGGDFNDYLAKADRLSFGSLEEACSCPIVFVAVQTPHRREYEGITPMPDERIDFDYSYLIQAVSEMAQYLKKGTIVTVISTCLPGTMRREIIPLLPPKVSLVYNPFFIAMGTVMRDFLHPEFVLMGSDDVTALRKMEAFYLTITSAPVRPMSIESAELTKVAYNTFISMKLGFVNTLLEICEKVPGADVDQVTEALKRADKRLISPAYLTAGMGDGGGCHPRDNIAMSSLARKLGLSFDFFEAVMLSREAQARWFAQILEDLQKENKDLPIIIYGYAFKPDVTITTGSHALLVADFLMSRSKATKIMLFDPVINGDKNMTLPAIYFIGCIHNIIRWRGKKFPKGSIVVDPHRVISDQKGVRVIRLGERREE